MGIQKPPIKKSIQQLIEAHDRLTELKKLEVTERMRAITESKAERMRALMDTKSHKTSSSVQNPRHINPYTLTPQGHDPEQWMTGSVNVNEPAITNKSEQHTHVVPTSGKKHKIEVEDMTHKIVPRRKSMIETIFSLIIPTRSLGPK